MLSNGIQGREGNEIDGWIEETAEKSREKKPPLNSRPIVRGIAAICATRDYSWKPIGSFQPIESVDRTGFLGELNGNPNQEFGWPKGKPDENDRKYRTRTKEPLVRQFGVNLLSSSISFSNRENEGRNWNLKLSVVIIIFAIWRFNYYSSI